MATIKLPRYRMSTNYCIEKNKPLSQSILWQLQREYFDAQGINAWVKQVPFFVTCNPVIANAYANVAFNFMRDWQTQHPNQKAETFYILELGTGSGMFSFYMVKRLNELKALTQADVNFCYVMTDFTENNLKYWQEHPALSDYVAQGCLDFAIYNLEQEHDIVLTESGKTLAHGDIHNPMIVCGNYIFDTVSHDCFTMKDGMLHESLVTLTTDEDNIDAGKPKSWDLVDIEHNARLCNPQAYYDDEHFNQVLQSYRGRLHNTNFLMPVAGLRAIKHLMHLANDKLLLISSDKAYSHIDELENLRHPSLTFHGSFSMMVNYDAIAQYFSVRGGDYHLLSQRKGLKTNVFCLGAQLDDLPETQRAIAQYVDNFSPADYFRYHRFMSDNFNNADADALAAHMELAQHDPYMFHRLAPRINEVIMDAVRSTRQQFIDMMPLIDENFYYMPASNDTLFDIAVFYHTVKEYDLALEYYQRSEALFGDRFNIHYNSALCHYYIGQSGQALALFKQSLLLDPDNQTAKDWVEYIESEGTSAEPL